MPIPTSSDKLNRRDFLKQGAAACAVLAAPIPLKGMKSPNLLVIHTDQQSCWSIGAYGGRLISTPNIDSLAKEGALFHNFFTNSAVCTPSRGCLLTGRYPHAHGAYKNNLPLNRDEVTFARALQEEGYDTGYAGKWHLDGQKKPGWVKESRSMGFEDCAFMFNRGHWKKIEDRPEGDPEVFPYKEMGDEKTYTTDWLAEKTMAFIRRPRKSPFCLMVSIPDPHQPYQARPPYDELLKPEDMPLPETLSQKNRPAWLGGKKNGGLAADKVRRSKAWYLGSVKLIDDSVGRILKCLEKEKILDETLVVFTTDHGDYMGEHGLMGKNQLYETAYRIPMLIRWPRRITKGTKIDSIVSTVDFYPTILALMGFDPGGRVQGRSAAPFLQGKKQKWEDVSHIHHSSLDRAGIFTPRYELAYVRDSDPILFNRENDPLQINNLFHDPRKEELVDALTERIIDHNIEVDAPAAEWLKRLRS